jgi:RNA polymerase sigma-70 factor, ECF subfamily
MVDSMAIRPSAMVARGGSPHALAGVDRHYILKALACIPAYQQIISAARASLKSANRRPCRFARRNSPLPQDVEKLDPTVVAGLYVEHGEELRRFLIGVLRNPQLAQDVLQVTFARLLDRGHETQEATRKSWLFRVAFHEAMAVRRRDNVGNRVVRQLAWEGRTGELAADAPLIRHETVIKIRELLKQLPAEQERMVRMRIYEEKTFAEISAELGIPLGTALGRMRAALIKLRAELNEDDWRD